MKKKRRQRSRPHGKPTVYEYECIDGNWTKHPVAYCKYHDGILTEAMMHTHKCRERHCRRLDETIEFE